MILIWFPSLDYYAVHRDQVVHYSQKIPAQVETEIHQAFQFEYWEADGHLSWSCGMPIWSSARTGKNLPSSRDRSKSGRINVFRICISHVLGEGMRLFILCVLKFGPQEWNLNVRKQQGLFVFSLWQGCDFQSFLNIILHRQLHISHIQTNFLEEFTELLFIWATLAHQCYGFGTRLIWGNLLENSYFYNSI